MQLDPNQLFAQLRPLLSLAGSILIIVGLLAFFGVNINSVGSGLELAVAGFLMKHI
jgi:hypothetical protein